MPEGDPGHQFQMLIKPIQKALLSQNVEAALRFAGHLLDVGGDVPELQDRKVHVLMRAMEGATTSVKTEFRTKLLERFGDRLAERSRARFSDPLDRL
jgi:hypothetical protein